MQQGLVRANGGADDVRGAIVRKILPQLFFFFLFYHYSCATYLDREKVHNARRFTKVVHNTPIGKGCPHHAKRK